MKHFQGPFAVMKIIDTYDVRSHNGQVVCTCRIFEHGGGDDRARETAQVIATALNVYDGLLAAAAGGYISSLQGMLDELDLEQTRTAVAQTEGEKE